MLNQIGRFKVGKKLGAGAQGTVYLCFDTQLQRRVAIKLLDRSVKESEQCGEERAMSRLQHPNIVSIYEAGEQRGLPFMVFEYVEGELLQRSDPFCQAGATPGTEYLPRHPSGYGGGAPGRYRASGSEARQHHHQSGWGGQEFKEFGHGPSAFGRA